jgi:hypothetical protein
MFEIEQRCVFTRNLGQVIVLWPDCEFFSCRLTKAVCIHNTEYIWRRRWSCHCTLHGSMWLSGGIAPIIPNLVVYVLLGISPASICSLPTLRNHVSVPSSKAGSRLTVYFQSLKMELIHGSETSANYILTPGKYPKEHIQHSNHGESLKSRIPNLGFTWG